MSDRYKILVIDDERLNRKIISDTLKPQYDIHLAKNAWQGFELAKKVIPNLILLDVMMPHETGFDAISWIKDTEILSEIPVIFLTSAISQEDEWTGFSLGAVDYITKPFSTAILKARVANHISLQQKKKELERLSRVDNLTNIANRRCFDEHLDAELRRARRNDDFIALMLCDIDHFKQYNDHYGHVAGDETLTKVAQCLQNSLRRSSDFVARYGGEEFAIILTGTPYEQVKLIGETCLTNIGDMKIEHEKSTTSQHVTISMGGIIIKPCANTTAQKLITEADGNLYKGKQNGRNQFILDYIE
ncbi:MAG: diguanylate cyclase [Alphaproteobacteria bacterium]|nr:diguanylate cyclase [Alphaproteobacteria bacterium]